jgi:hypothetical protein
VVGFKFGRRFGITDNDGVDGGADNTHENAADDESHKEADPVIFSEQSVEEKLGEKLHRHG